jgi:GTPase KRas protein
VYSITDRASFEAVVKYRNKLYAVKDKDLTEYIPFVVFIRISTQHNVERTLQLVGNKCDLEDKRQVTTAQGKAVSEQWKCPFLEVMSICTLQSLNVFRRVQRTTSTLLRSSMRLLERFVRTAT